MAGGSQKQPPSIKAVRELGSEEASKGKKEGSRGSREAKARIRRTCPFARKWLELRLDLVQGPLQTDFGSGGFCKERSACREKGVSTGRRTASQAPTLLLGKNPRIERGKRDRENDRRHRM